MKIKSDFVTNSSSTVFVLIARSLLTRDGIRGLLGVRPSSPLEPIADRLFELLQLSGPAVTTVEEADEILAIEDFVQVVGNSVRAAIDAGHEVRIGTFSTDGDEVEALLCCDSFEAEDSEYYLNALRCVW